MDFGKLHFGSIAINGVTYEHDVVIDRGKIRSARRSLQEIPRAVRTHPSLSRGEGTLEVPCLVIGTRNYGSLPVMDEVKREPQVREREGLAHDNARSPVEMSLKARLRELLRK